MTTTTTTTTTDAALIAAAKLLLTYTAGRSDIWMLAGPAKASCRAHVMSVLLGRKTPQSKSGVTAIVAEFHARAGITGPHIAARDDAFHAWLMSVKS